jgi:arylsulfatase A-like enzyme
MEGFTKQLYNTCYLVSITLTSGCGHTDKEMRQPPNIFIAIADDASFPHMGAYGCKWVSTPAFDRVARSGILFNNAYTPNAKCAPSRACLLTGRNSWQLEEAANHWCFFPAKFKTYPEALQEHGYVVGYTGKGWAPGIAGSVNNRERELTGKAYDRHTLVPPTWHISTNDYAANFRDFLNSREKGRPFCFWYGSTEPHRAYEYGSGIALGNKKTSDVDAVCKCWPDDDSVRTDMLDYAFEIEYFDKHLELMLSVLEEAGELENTLVIITSDNGMPFPRIKGQAYEPSNHMPLAVMWTNGIKKPGRVVNDFVSFIDIAPTILEVAGISEQKSLMEPIQGKSLTDIFHDTHEGWINPERDHVLIGKERHDVGRPGDAGYPIRAMVNRNYLYILNFEPERWPSGNPVTGYLNCDGSPTKTIILNMRRNYINAAYWDACFGKRPSQELYNILGDPDCLDNLARESEYQAVLNQLNIQMLDELKTQHDPRVLGNGSVFDHYVYADEKNRNFYDKFKKGMIRKKDAGWVNPGDFEEVNSE